jgi:hypothetical protein
MKQKERILVAALFERGVGLENILLRRRALETGGQIARHVRIALLATTDKQ